MAGKNGKKGVDASGGEEIEDKALPTPETPKAEITQAVEAQQPNPTPEGQDTYVSQQMFGQKTYDEQMKVENKFAGLNRTDEIAQLGGASKLEVDLAQMKIFSTERIGDDLYAAIQRGDTHKVEAMAGLNSDRRMTEAQILVLLKAKREHDDDVAKKLAADAYYTQELESKKKHADDEATFYDKRADDQNTRTASVVSGQSNNFAQSGFNDDGSYTDDYGGTYNTNGTYTDREGYTVYGNGRVVDPAGNWEMQDGSESYSLATNTTTLTEEVDPQAPPALDDEGNPLPVAPPRSVDVNFGPNQELGRRLAEKANETRTLAENDNTLPVIGVPGTTAEGGAPPAVDSKGRPIAPTSPKKMEFDQSVANAQVHANFSIALTGMSQAEQRKFIKWDDERKADLSEAMKIRNVAERNAKIAEIQQKLSLADYARLRLLDKDLSPADRAKFQEQLPILEQNERDNIAKTHPRTSVALPATPAASGTAVDAAAVAGVDTTKLVTTDTSTPVDPAAAGPTAGDGGFYDEFGGYYTADGGYYDGLGGYYAPDGGYHDPDGGYTWPDGAYQDQYNNYVDAKGNLYAADGTVMMAEDHKKGDGTNMDFKKLLEDNSAKGNMFDPATPPSQAKQDAFLATAPHWWSKTAEQREEWKANKGGQSNYLASSSYFDSKAYTFDLPVYDPLTNVYKPLDSTGPGLTSPVMMA